MNAIFVEFGTIFATCARSDYPSRERMAEKEIPKKMLQPVNSDDMFAGVLVWQERTANGNDDGI